MNKNLTTLSNSMLGRLTLIFLFQVIHISFVSLVIDFLLVVIWLAVNGGLMSSNLPDSVNNFFRPSLYVFSFLSILGMNMILYKRVRKRGKCICLEIMIVSVIISLFNAWYILTNQYVDLIGYADSHYNEIFPLSYIFATIGFILIMVTLYIVKKIRVWKRDK